MRSRKIKNRKIVVDNREYIYSVIEYTSDIQIMVYISKVPILKIHLNYAESWGIDVFRPKTIEILIQYYNKYYTSEKKTKELWLNQEKELFDMYLNLFFLDEEKELKEFYLGRLNSNTARIH